MKPLPARLGVAIRWSRGESQERSSAFGTCFASMALSSANFTLAFAHARYPASAPAMFLDVASIDVMPFPLSVGSSPELADLQHEAGFFGNSTRIHG